MTIFLVTGATGNLGGAIVRRLRERVPTADIRVLVRSVVQGEKFAGDALSARVADYSDRTSLDSAFSGIDTAVFVSSPVLDTVVRASQHRAVIDSAVAAAVSHIVYTSAMGAPHDPGHSAAEAALVESGVSHTILRNALYTDPFLSKALAEARTGFITSASGGRPIVTASIADLAEAAARAAADPPEKSLWELRGPAWTFTEAAEALSRVLGRQVQSDEVVDDETGAFRVLYPLIRRGVFSDETADLGELLGRDPQGIESVARQLLL